MKRLTIITICRNIASTIERTCESIVNQTFQDFEWIVVDGASTDGTVNILKKYSNRIDIFISEPDNGVYNAMNKGIMIANGEYIIFMNGGDNFFDNQTLSNVFSIETKADIVHGLTYENQTPHKLDKGEFYQRGIVHQSTFINTKLHQKYLFDETYKICADYDFFLKVLFKGYKFQSIPIRISKFYKGGIGEIYHELALREQKQIKNRYYNFLNKLKYDPEWGKKIIHFKMILTHPRYIAGWVLRKLKIKK